MIEASQSGFLNALGWAILNSFWQMALLWVAFQLISGLLYRKMHSKKSLLATLMMVTGFIWFILTFFSILYNSHFRFILIDTEIAFVSVNEKLYTWFQQLLPGAAIVYILFLCLSFFRFRKNYLYLNQLRNKGLKKINVEWKIFAKNLSAIMGIKKPVTVWLSEFVSSPVTIGYLKPIILVPIAAINNLTTRQLEALLLHELAHIKRHDYVINLLITWIRTIMYFNPFISLFVKSIESDREKSCDEMVIQFQNDPQEYAKALLQLVRTKHNSKPLTIAASGNKFDLLQRIEMILGINNKRFLSFNKLSALFAGLLLAIGLNTILMTKLPGTGSTSHNALTHFSSPFISITDELLPLPELPVGEIKRFSHITSISEPNEVASSEFMQHSRRVARKEILTDNVGIIKNNPVSKSFLSVNFASSIPTPVLKHYKEIQVKKASDESKRILEDIQWKALEKNIADAFTKTEKEKIRSLYSDAFENYDWKSWENKIRQSYNDIDWENINETLDNAIYKIKLDSLQNVYSNISVNIELLIARMKEINQTAISDSDITIKNLEEKNIQIQKLLNKINGLKTRKIIRL